MYKVDDIIFTDNLDDVTQNTFGENNNYCLIACMKGMAQLSLNGKAQQLGANEMIILRTEVFEESFMRTPDFKGFLLSIDNKMVQELMMQICRVEPRWWEVTKKLQNNPVFELSDEKYRRLLLTYFDLLEQYMKGEQTEYRKKTYMLLAQAASYEVLASINKMMNFDDDTETITASDKIAKTFVDDLKNDDGTHREVAWYAKRLNITPKYLSHVCKEKLKITASGMIQEVTCERIKYYLLRTDMNIKEIAYRLKFPTVSFFCKYVRQHLGDSPLEIRKKGRL